MKKQLLLLFITVLLSILVYTLVVYVYNAGKPTQTHQVLTVPPSEDFDNTIGERK